MRSASGSGFSHDPSRQDMKPGRGPVQQMVAGATATEGELYHLKREPIMLTTSTRLKLQNICSRLAQGQFVLQESRFTCRNCRT